MTGTYNPTDAVTSPRWRGAMSWPLAGNLTGNQIITFDPPKHTAHRGLLMGLITPKRLKENEEFMWRLADRQLDVVRRLASCLAERRR